MPVSGRPTLRLRGDLFELSAGGSSWFALHLLACLLACVKGHFARLFSSLFSLSTLPLVSIWSGKYSTDWVQCDGAFGGGRSQGCHGYLLPRASLLPGSTNLFRHHLPSSSIVDEFNNGLIPASFTSVELGSWVIQKLPLLAARILPFCATQLHCMSPHTRAPGTHR